MRHRERIKSNLRLGSVFGVKRSRIPSTNTSATQIVVSIHPLLSPSGLEYSDRKYELLSVIPLKFISLIKQIVPYQSILTAYFIKKMMKVQIVAKAAAFNPVSDIPIPGSLMKKLGLVLMIRRPLSGYTIPT